MDSPSLKEDHISQIPSMQMLVNLTPPTLTHTLIPPYDPVSKYKFTDEDYDWKDNYYKMYLVY